MPSEQVITSIWLDESYRIVEITSSTRLKNEIQPYNFNVIALDGNGDYYSKNFFGSNYTGKNAFEYHLQYISKDGIYSFRRNLNPRRSDKGSEHVLITSYEVSDPKDWDDFYLIITHAWAGGLYKYTNKIQSHAIGHKLLSLYTVDDKEVCADGLAFTKTTNVSYDSPTADHGFCINDW